MGNQLVAKFVCHNDAFRNQRNNYGIRMYMDTGIHHCDYHTSLFISVTDKFFFWELCQVGIQSHSKSGNMLQSQDLLKLLSWAY